MGSKLKVNLIVTFCVCAVGGIMSLFVPKHSPWFYMVGFVLAFCATQFIVIYSLNAGRPVPSWSKWLVFLTWWFSMHFIFMYCKGFKGLLASISYLVFVFAAMVIPAVLLGLVLLFFGYEVV